MTSFWWGQLYERCRRVELFDADARVGEGVRDVGEEADGDVG